MNMYRGVDISYAGFGADTPNDSLSNEGHLASCQLSQSTVTPVALMFDSTQIVSVAWLATLLEYLEYTTSSRLVNLE